MNKEILENISVLYVEDEKDVREFTTKLLGSLVKKVYSAEDGLDGLEQFKENKDSIDLIVSDINMPKMDGLEMCTQIKEINKEIPIVITSAHNDPSFLKKAINVGVSTYAMKPIDLYQLVESMIKAIEPIYLKEKLENLNISLETRVDNEIQKIKSILDAQDNIILLSNSTTIKNVNKRFLEFFKVNSVEEFKKLSDNIFDCFIDDYGFISKESLKNQKCYYEYIKSLKEVDRVVKIKNSQDEIRIFTINVDNYDDKNEFYVISLTDITELKEKSNLLEYQASHDNLTGLFNRNKFNSLFGKEIRRGHRYKNDLSLVILDIDFFKVVNDKYGHQIGDQVLKEISSIILQNVREHDTVVRWGGEEFLILLPETDIEGAVIVAEKIRSTICNRPLSKENINITASFGITLMNEKDTEESFISRSDEALYEAKENGRNKVVTKI
ncbi:diguanylate cyclase [Poseidonibacter lekithochrous]|uniref:GGDEF domain-containing response regulator n=1 Tax=Poseidonibacter TaxID=2321187 RepID=UPI001C09DD84|nr:MULTISPECIES: diguanylate cyclase [Poseidonibacter]MBU3014895.1 diguanylate cyclase [Poseidonibacter lekithochrous]MDO6828193.1 diguanylate cyclase [Poseidonibacter sp. 1_MG-2023]